MKQLFKIKEEDKKYTKKITVPQYEPSDRKPELAELCNTEKYKELIRAINKSNVTEEEKEFLRLGAARHFKFRYDKIADYYAHSNAEMQELMEQSALVILDMDDAIANGYVKLTKNIKEIMNRTGEFAGEENEE